MSNPYNNNLLNFLLRFKNPDHFGDVAISESVKFDGASFVVAQDNDRLGRDVSFMNDSISLFFYKGTYDTETNPQMLPNGTIVNNLTQGFEYLIEAYRSKGFESEVEYVITKDGLEFITGVLDFYGCDTDDFTFFSCKVVQDTQRQIVNRRDDVVVNMFNDEDLDGNYIEPIQTHNILLKAKPITQISKYNSYSELDNYRFFAEDVSGDEAYYYFNICNGITQGDIDNSLSFLDNVKVDLSDDEGYLGSFFPYIEAQEQLSNINIQIKDVNLRQNIDTDNGGDGFIETSLKIVWGETLATSVGDYIVFSELRTDADGFFEYQNNEINVNIPTLEAGHGIWIYFRTKIVQSSDNPFDNPRIEAFTTLKPFTIDIIATSTAIDSVIKGVRYIDAIKQNVKSISGLDVEAPVFDVGGKYYDQMLFSGNLIKGRDDVAFSLEFKDLMDSIKEVNADYQILKDKIYLGQYLDFYANKEIAFLDSYPDESYSETFNDRFTINTFEYSYKKFEQDDDEDNTIDAVHTDTQWLLPNKQVEDTYKVEVVQIRDPYKIEKTRKEAIKDTTSTNNDDDIFLIDVVSLAPNSKGGFTKRLTHYINNDGNLQMLNDGSFSWNTLGFGVGDSISVLNTSNGGTRQVLELSDNIITLQGGNESINSALTQIEYYFSNVLYTNRTNEGFAEINNLINSTNFSNLKYTIKRNLKEFYNMLATSCRYHLDKTIKNTYFKDNGDLETRLNTETELTIEDETILVTDLGVGRLTDKLIKVKLVASYENAVSILNALNTINADGSIGGFIRTKASNGKVIKGYVKDIDYEPASETFVATFEERNDGDYLTITSSDGNIIINEVGYDIDTDLEWFEINDGYLRLFDNDNRPIINPIYYDKVLVNGVSSNNSTELSEKLILL